MMMEFSVSLKLLVPLLSLNCMMIPMFHSTPINRQVGISENIFITVQNDSYGIEQRVCSIDSMTYGDGETIPTSSPCEHCICRPPGFACTIISCEYRPGCRAIRRSNQCCPEYRCECEKDGRIYQNGEKIVDSNNPCEICYCQGGEIVCAVIDCYWRSDCQPRYIENRCCPLYDHCPPTSNVGPFMKLTPVGGTTRLPPMFSWFNLSAIQSQKDATTSPTPIPAYVTSKAPISPPPASVSIPEMVVIAGEKVPVMNIMTSSQEVGGDENSVDDGSQSSSPSSSTQGSVDNVTVPAADIESSDVLGGIAPSSSLENEILPEPTTTTMDISMVILEPSTTILTNIIGIDIIPSPTETQGPDMIMASTSTLVNITEEDSSLSQGEVEVMDVDVVPTTTSSPLVSQQNEELEASTDITPEMGGDMEMGTTPTSSNPSLLSNPVIISEVMTEKTIVEGTTSPPLQDNLVIEDNEISTESSPNTNTLKPLLLAVEGESESDVILTTTTTPSGDELPVVVEQVVTEHSIVEITEGMMEDDQIISTTSSPNIILQDEEQPREETTLSSGNKPQGYLILEDDATTISSDVPSVTTTNNPYYSLQDGGGENDVENEEVLEQTTTSRPQEEESLSGSETTTTRVQSNGEVEPPSENIIKDSLTPSHSIIKNNNDDTIEIIPPAPHHDPQLVPEVESLVQDKTVSLNKVEVEEQSVVVGNNDDTVEIFAAEVETTTIRPGSSGSGPQVIQKEEQMLQDSAIVIYPSNINEEPVMIRQEEPVATTTEVQQQDEVEIETNTAPSSLISLRDGEEPAQGSTTSTSDVTQPPQDNIEGTTPPAPSNMVGEVPEEVMSKYRFDLPIFDDDESNEIKEENVVGINEDANKGKNEIVLTLPVTTAIPEPEVLQDSGPTTINPELRGDLDLNLGDVVDSTSTQRYADEGEQSTPSITTVRNYRNEDPDPIITTTIQPVAARADMESTTQISYREDIEELVSSDDVEGSGSGSGVTTTVISAGLYRDDVVVMVTTTDVSPAIQQDEQETTTVRMMSGAKSELEEEEDLQGLGTTQVVVVVVVEEQTTTHPAVLLNDTTDASSRLVSMDELSIPKTGLIIPAISDDMGQRHRSDMPQTGTGENESWMVQRAKKQRKLKLGRNWWVWKSRSPTK